MELIVPPLPCEHYVAQLRRAYSGLVDVGRPKVIAAAAAALVLAQLAEEAQRRPSAARAAQLARVSAIAVRRADEADREFIGGPLEALQLNYAARVVRSAAYGLARAVTPGPQPSYTPNSDPVTG